MLKFGFLQQVESDAFEFSHLRQLLMEQKAFGKPAMV